ncbi:uncharacterized protein CANTADRAFT_55447 [Suhomyces tanzawaensis NRRL Y-17324]|uniref:SUN-like protein 1 n=1 Tax=Suhomyces tanzawaensis NRRL Y-17324 TaxID=984487 RepID=A0A1E4SDB0_9ASCO|nr:uncharacterized protein CANTADRAFT_55447 [Suhomyces tanzawaensis NRRL Y-17324]ODV77458.1 hypothetical protein CANTADRAFT_55447 [Suhomyces tanzawaensis NRRL Y-17324]
MPTTSTEVLTEVSSSLPVSLLSSSSPILDGTIYEVDDSELQDLEIDVSIEFSNGSNRTSNAPQNQSNLTLDDCHFMSFEEWKKQKTDGTNDKEEKSTNYTVNIKNESSSITSDLAIHIENITTPQSKASKEDQGKVYKDKFNYASADCAATVVKTNSLASGAMSILVENKDSYLLNQCSSPNKFVIIELCQDILVENVVIGNFEFFSSMFRDVRISVSDRFPATNWRVLGDFEAENIRDIQTFKIQNPLIWARYLKLEIISHYGNEFYCPISIVRVHGKTMMEEFKEGEVPLESNVPEVEPELTIDLEDLDETASIDEECRVVLPHLRLNEFLKYINTTGNDYCEVTAEPGTTQTIEIQTTQESIYKNIMKRLSLLESNASLSLLYIEEQSKLLSGAFTSLERRQSNNYESLIESFNSTLHNQLLSFKKTYANMHNEYAKLFKMQEFNHKSLLNESKRKVEVLGSEITFHKRLSIFNSVLLACLLVYVILTRDAYIDEMEVRGTSGKKKRRRDYFPAGLVNRTRRSDERIRGKRWNG